MKLRALRAHVSSYPDPIAFAAGETLRLGRHDDEYPGWVRTTTADGKEGWAPLAWIRPGPDGATGIALRDYSACELDTAPGESLEALQALAGWLWVRNAAGACGWVPADSAGPA